MRPILTASLVVLGLMASPAIAEQTIQRTLASAPKSLDPQKAASAAEVAVLTDLYEGLVARDASAAIIPGAASEWSVSADGLTMTFKLRPTAWSNGEPVTAEDFVLSFRRLFDKASPSPLAERLTPVKNAARIRAGRSQPAELGVRAIDAETLELKLEGITPSLLDILAGPVGLPVFLRTPAPTPEPKKPETAETSAPKAAEVPAAKAPADEPKPDADTADNKPDGDVKTADAGERPKPSNPIPPPVAPTVVEKPALFGPVVNGPFRLASQTADSWTLIRNEGFHDAKEVAADKVVYSVVASPEAAAKLFADGKADIVDQAPVYGLPALKEKLGGAVRIAPYLGTYYIALDTARRPYSDMRVRRALSLAIDRDALAKEVWGGTMFPTASFVPDLPGFKPVAIEAGGETLEARRAAAKALLAEAKFPPDKNTRIELRIPRSDLNRRTAQAVASDWAAIGVSANIVETDTSAHYKLLAGKAAFGSAIAAWIGDGADAASFLDILIGGSDATNFPHYASAEYDRTVKLAAATIDPDARSPLLEKASELLARDVPLIPLLRYGSINIVSTKVKGWQDNVLNIHPSRYLSRE